MKKSLLLLFFSVLALFGGERFIKIDKNGVAIVDKSTLFFKEWAIVLDKQTNLMWEMKNSSNVSKTYTWEEALNYCENLVLNGYSDWRLPNQYEVKSLIDYTQKNPVVNATYFPPSLTPTRIWASTSESDVNAWYLALNNGEVFYNKKTTNYGVMCVRSDL